MALSCVRNSHSLSNSGLHPQTIALLLLVSFDVVDSAELVSTWLTREAPKRFAGLLPVLLGFSWLMSDLLSLKDMLQMLHGKSADIVRRWSWMSPET
jgi:hypothetical protein